MRLGLIEGFYGPLWSWDERHALAGHLAREGYRFWHYAPKADAGLRDDWRRCWNEDHAGALRAFAAHCRALGLEFGIGITPLGLAEDAAETDWRALAARLAELDAIGPDELLLAFDDVRGDIPDLARRQARVVDWAAARTTCARVVVCPTYYSDDPALDRLYGPRPAGYLRELGRALDPRVGVYWTGQEICAREVTRGHMERVAESLRREPLLWDNYPVNDSPLMGRYLHLRAFTARSPALAEVLEAHAVNPALQPTLSAVAAITLAERYRKGERYQYMTAFRDAARKVLGRPLAEQVELDLELLADTGRDRLGEHTGELRARYAAFEHPGAREIVRWLDGEYDTDGPAVAADDVGRTNATR